MWSVNIDDKFKEIKEVQSQKFVGITIDEHLNWNTHTDKLWSSLKSSYYLFKNLVKYCDIGTLKTVYHSYFESKIKYGILSWGVTKNQNITSLLKCQKRILRIITELWLRNQKGLEHPTQTVPLRFPFSTLAGLLRGRYGTGIFTRAY